MLNTIQNGSLTQVATFSPDAIVGAAQRQEAFERDRHRVYAIAYWMTGNELAAEDLMVDAFRAAFLETAIPTAEEVDLALVAELRKMFDIPVFTLDCIPCHGIRNVRKNVLRTDLEIAVFALPSTEKLIFLMHDLEGYDHDRVARLLGMTERESRLGLHQARLRLRELLAK
jgi:RNA polymerase sigma-70 factor (ECF subfamily)